MRRRWKKAAEHADRPAANNVEVAGSVAWALTEDWKLDVPPQLSKAVCEIFETHQSSLFPDQAVKELDAAKRGIAGQELGQLFIDCAIQEANHGARGIISAEIAAANALSIWIAREGRSIEEHFLRESSVRRADRVRRRLEDSLGRKGIEALSRALIHEAPETRRAPVKRSGIDEGVRLK
jgi:hypothetical protein